MIVDFAAIVVGLVAAVSVVVPCVICCCLWIWYAARRYYNLQREAEDLRQFISNLSIRCHLLETNTKPVATDDIDEDDFPSH